MGSLASHVQNATRWPDCDRWSFSADPPDQRRQRAAVTRSRSRSAEDALPPRATAQIFDHLFLCGKLLSEGRVRFRLNREELRQVVDLLGQIIDLLLVGIDLLVATGELFTKVGNKGIRTGQEFSEMTFVRFTLFLLRDIMSFVRDRVGLMMDKPSAINSIGFQFALLDPALDGLLRNPEVQSGFFGRHEVHCCREKGHIG